MSQDKKKGFSGPPPNGGGGPGKQPDKDKKKPGNGQSTQQKFDFKKKPPIPPRPLMECRPMRAFPIDPIPGPLHHELARICQKIRDHEPPVRKKDLNGPLALSDRLWIDGTNFVPPMPKPPRYSRRPFGRDELYEDKSLIPWAFKNGFRRGLDILEPFMTPEEEVRPPKVKTPKMIKPPKSLTPKRCIPKPPCSPPIEFDCHDDNEEELEEEVDKHFDIETMLQEQRRNLVSERMMRMNERNDMYDFDFSLNWNNSINGQQTAQSHDERVVGPSHLTNQLNKPRPAIITDLARELTKPAIVVRRESSGPDVQECWARSWEPAVLPRIPEEGEQGSGRRSRARVIKDPNLLFEELSANSAQGDTENCKPSLPPPQPLKPAIKPGLSHFQRGRDGRQSLPHTDENSSASGKSVSFAKPSMKDVIDCPYAVNQKAPAESKASTVTGKTFTGLKHRPTWKTSDRAINRGKFFCGSYLRDLGLGSTNKTKPSAKGKGHVVEPSNGPEKEKPVKKAPSKERCDSRRASPFALRAISSLQIKNSSAPAKKSIQVNRPVQDPNTSNKAKSLSETLSAPVRAASTSNMKKAHIPPRKTPWKVDSAVKVQTNGPTASGTKIDMISETYIPPKYSPNNPTSGNYEAVVPRLPGTRPVHPDLTTRLLDDIDERISRRLAATQNKPGHENEVRTLTEIRDGLEYRRNNESTPPTDLLPSAVFLSGALKFFADDDEPIPTMNQENEDEDTNLSRPQTSMSLDELSLNVNEGVEADVELNDLDNFSIPSRGGSVCGDGFRSLDGHSRSPRDRFRDFYDQRDGFNGHLHLQSSFQRRFNTRDNFHRTFWRSQSNTSFPSSELSLARSSPSATVSALELSDTEDIVVDTEELADYHIPPAEMEESILETLQETCTAIAQRKPMSCQLSAALQNAENDEFNNEEWKNLQDAARGILQGTPGHVNNVGPFDDFWDPNAESSDTSEDDDEDEAQSGPSSQKQESERDRGSPPNLQQLARILKIVKLSGMGEPSADQIQDDGSREDDADEDAGTDPSDEDNDAGSSGDTPSSSQH